MSEIPADCLPFDEDLSALIDAELNAEREAEVRAHVEGCPRCALRLAALGNVDLALADVPAPEVPADLSRRLAARLASEAPRRAQTAPPGAERRGRGLRVAGGLAAAAAVGLAVFLGLPDEEPERGPQLARAPVPAIPESLPMSVVVDPVVERTAEVMPEPPSALADEDLEDLVLMLAVEKLAEPDDMGLVANLELVEMLVDLGLPEGA